MYYLIFFLFLIETLNIATSESVLNLPKGAVCRYDKYSGVCVKQHRCLSALRIEGLLTEIPPFCNTDGEVPIVCCPDCKLPLDTRNAVYVPCVGIRFKKGRPAHDKCLEYLADLPYKCKKTQSISAYSSWSRKKQCMRHELAITTPLSGGTNANRYDYPHMALLGYGDDLQTIQWLCGGSVISERFVLTAAHCISSPLLGNVSYIAVGMLKRSDPPEYWNHYKVKRIIPYPEYKSPSKYHDIALLETEKNIQFSQAVLPACLDSSDYFYEFPKNSLEVAGWGDLGHGRPTADTLQYAYLEEFTDEECDNQYKWNRVLLYGFDNITQMCYGTHDDIIDTCQGDSGGPIMQYVHEYCQFEIRGVTSSGNRCGQMGGAGLYTRIEYYIPWIEEIVWPKEKSLDPKLLDWLKAL